MLSEWGKHLGGMYLLCTTTNTYSGWYSWKLPNNSGTKRARVLLQKMKSVPKKEEQSKEVKSEKKEAVKPMTIGNLTFPEPLPLKKPSEREWEAVGMKLRFKGFEIEF